MHLCLHLRIYERTIYLYLLSHRKSSVEILKSGEDPVAVPNQEILSYYLDQFPYPSLYLQRCCNSSFAFINTGQITPNGSKTFCTCDKTIFFVIFSAVGCEGKFDNERVSSFVSHISPSTVDRLLHLRPVYLQSLKSNLALAKTELASLWKISKSA